MKNLFRIISLLFVSLAQAQNGFIPVKENLVVENIPELPVSYIADLKNYTEFRSASLVDWHPLKKEMFISTRFGNSSQLHYVKMAGGDRKQITFFDEPVSGATFEPSKGEYILFTKDVGGNEFGQIYRLDIATKKITLLTDGKKSQNGGIRWCHKGLKMAYASTKRNGKDRDFYIMDPMEPEKEKRILENEGGGWGIVDWSPNDDQLLIGEGISINESRLYILDITTGVKTRILPTTEERTTNSGIGFSLDGKGFYFLTNKQGEFNQLAYYVIATKEIKYLSQNIPWDIEDAELSDNGKMLAFLANENGLSKMYVLNTANQKYSQVPNIPIGIIGGLNWTGNDESIGFNLVSYNAPSDIYEYNIKSKKIIRWTESELGGIDVSTMQAPELISWTSFDGKQISGYLYKASSKFTGKRPVMINIHGGPEGQSRPNFLGRLNYYVNELGISIIFPNVRGSNGYGKSFLDADNGFKREESVKDIGALFDWIAFQENLDKDRVMVTGGSYGGYMTLAVACTYSDKIKCALDVVGISNFNTFLKNTEAYRRDLRRVEYGDERDADMSAFLEKISPLNNTDKIKKPMFIVQGETDPRVPYTEAVQMKDKIIAQKGICWFLMAKDEGHGFKKKDNIDFQFYATIEYIKRYLIN